ncbi:MAG: hypothetical protein ACI4LX_10605 [Treponema sp.]
MENKVLPTGQGIGATAKQSTAEAGGDEEDEAQAELRKARFFAQAKNDPETQATYEKLTQKT